LWFALIRADAGGILADPAAVELAAPALSQGGWVWYSSDDEQA